MLGFYNLLLNINVSQQHFELRILQDRIFLEKLGGKGLGIHLLLENNPPGVHPFSPENHIVFTTGPTCGPIRDCCQYGVHTKSPQPGLYSKSNSGGTVAKHITSTGFDAIMIHGSSYKPVWLEISESGVTFHSAEDLRGLETVETKTRINAWMKKNRAEPVEFGALIIGPAGEKAAGTSVLADNDGKSANQAHFDTLTVLASKNIKAVIFRGNAKKKLADAPMINKMLNDILARSIEPACRIDLPGMAGPGTISKKIEQFIEWEDRQTIFDSFIFRNPYRNICQWEDLSIILKGVMGIDFDKTSMRKIAAGIINDTRKFNLREGHIPENEFLPGFIYTNTLSENNRVMTGKEIRNSILKEYYKARKWNDN